ncbi:MAG: hypothetical protein AAGU27_27770 [Dehalobacterium sp.]
MEFNKQLNKKKFWVIYLCCCFLGFSWILLAGCTQKDQGTVTASIPRTPEEAGIAVLDSSNCESCHLSPEMISTFEKPKTGEPVQSEGG